MPSVGERRKPKIGDFSKDPLYSYAAAFQEATQAVMREATVDYNFEPVKASMFPNGLEVLRNFYLENCVVDREHKTIEESQDALNDMNELFANDVEAVRENAVMGMSNYNPMLGLSLPMHKYLMLNCVFAQAVPRYVAKTPSWTETMEIRYMITPDGKKIDLANQQHMIFEAWKSANKPIEVPIALPEVRTTDILDKYFHVPKTGHNLSTATHICAVAVEDYAYKGDTVLTIDPDTNEITESEATADGTAIVWKPWKAEFTPGYGEYNRNIIQPVDIVLTDADGKTPKNFHDTIFATQKENMFEINSGGYIKAIKMWARYDASSRMLKTNRVTWEERTTFVQIPEADGITIPVTPEEIKDIGASYGINQITKYMSMIKDVLENVKDDDIKEHLDESYLRLDDDHKLAKTIDFAPRSGYYSDHLEWLQKTFMNTLDQFITGLLTVLRDPNMQICIIGRPGIIRQITPIEYTYSVSSSVGPVQLDFTKTVVTSDKRVYNFISSDKLFNNDNLIILLIPKNTNRIVYRLYDYQMYISNEIRDAENPALPALTAFQRYKFFEYQPVQGRLFVANPTGLREHLPNIDPIGKMYTNNDLGSVFSSYNPETGRNEVTPNVLPEPPASGDGTGSGVTPPVGP